MSLALAPYLSKATGTPLAKAAARIMLGETIADLRAAGLLPAAGGGGELPLDAPVAVKEAVLPFGRFRDADGRGVDTVLGPEMRSTGEVMGIDVTFGTASRTRRSAAGGSPGRGLTATRSAPPQSGAVWCALPRVPGWPPRCRASRLRSAARWASGPCSSTPQN